MKTILYELLLSFLTAFFTGITLNTPSSALVSVGIAGLLGWLANTLLIKNHYSDLVAAVASALVVGFFAEIMAKVHKKPATVFIVSGIIPLVPGITTYNSTLSFLDKQYTQGLSLGLRAFLIASYIAAGLAIVPIIMRFIRWFRPHIPKRR